MDIIALEIGNTSVQLVIQIKGERVLAMRFPNDTLKKAPRLLLDALAPYEVKDVFFSSVTPKQSALLGKYLEERGYRVKEIASSDLEGHLKIDVNEGVEVGIDLLLDSLAVEEPSALILDLGTCNKLIYKKDGAFSGVAIAPGFEMGAKAMGSGAEMLSCDLELPLPKGAVGKNTPDALSSGLFLLPTLGFISLCDSLDPERKLPRYLTGGSASRLTSFFPTFTYVPNLALEGLLLAASFAK